MRAVCFAAILAGSIVTCLAPFEAWAGCDEEKVVDIAISAGKSCWVYRGTATVFVGEFGGGQSISARMSGEGAEYDEASGRTITRIGPRTPEVTGPGGFSTAGSEHGAMAFDAPRGGIYRFSFSPCAMWGGNGTVEICAR